MAIVGSRSASKEELAVARLLAQKVVQKGKYVVSGLALGIDTAAHEGALDAGGQTVGVLPLEKSESIYPAKNTGLARRILNQGALLYPFGMPRPYPRKLQQRLIDRDEVVAHLVESVIVVADDAVINGGTAWTVNFAWALGVPVVRVDSSGHIERNPECILKRRTWISEVPHFLVLQSTHTNDTQVTLRI